MPKQQILSDIDENRQAEEDAQMKLVHQEILQNECDKLGLTPDEMNKIHKNAVRDSHE